MGADDDERVADERNVGDLADQLLRELQRKHAALDPAATGDNAPALTRAKEVVARLAVVFGDETRANGGSGDGDGGLGTNAAALAGARYDLPNDADAFDELMRRVRDVVRAPPPPPPSTTAIGTGCESARSRFVRANTIGADRAGELSSFDETPSPDLNREQNAALAIVMNWMRADYNHRYV